MKFTMRGHVKIPEIADVLLRLVDERETVYKDAKQDKEDREVID